MNLRKDEKGAALVTVFLVVLVIFITGTAFLQSATIERKIGINQRQEIQALYAADGGIARFLAKLEADPAFADWPAGWQSEFEDLPVGDGYIDSVTAVDQGTIIRVTSVGEIRRPDGTVRAKKSVEAVILKPPYANAFAGAITTTSGNTLEIHGSSEITGNFAYKGDVSINSSVTINGDIVAGGNVSTSGDISGSVLAGGTITNSGYITAPDEGFIQSHGNLTNSGQLTTGAGGIVHTDETLTNSGIISSDYYYGVGIVNSGNLINGVRIDDRSETVVFVPGVPPVDYQWYEDNADVVHEVAMEFTGSDLEAMSGSGGNPYIIYVKGDVTLDKKLSVSGGGNYSGVGIIISEGDIDIEGDLVPDDPSASALALINSQWMDVGGNAQLWGVFISEGTYSTNGTVNVYGSLVPTIMDLSGSLNIEYQQSMVTQLGLVLPGNEHVVKAWYEKYPAMN